MDVFEINSFIDDCYLIKNVILENQNQIYIDQNDQLCKQTELFMEEIIKNRVALEIKRQEEFPTLGAVNKSNSIILSRCTKSERHNPKNPTIIRTRTEKPRLLHTIKSPTNISS